MESNNWIVAFFKNFFSFFSKFSKPKLDKAVLVDKVAATKEKKTPERTSRGSKRVNRPWWKEIYNVRDRKSLHLNKQPIGFGNCKPLIPFKHTSKYELFSMRVKNGNIL